MILKRIFFLPSSGLVQSRWMKRTILWFRVCKHFFFVKTKRFGNNFFKLLRAVFSRQNGWQTDSFFLAWICPLTSLYLHLIFLHLPRILAFWVDFSFDFRFPINISTVNKTYLQLDAIFKMERLTQPIYGKCLIFFVKYLPC